MSASPPVLGMSPQPTIPPTPNPVAPPPPSSSSQLQGQLVLPNPALKQTNPDVKKKMVLKYEDANFSSVCLFFCVVSFQLSSDFAMLQDEKRARSAQYYVVPGSEAPRGTKRARAEDLF